MKYISGFQISWISGTSLHSQKLKTSKSFFVCVGFYLDMFMLEIKSRHLKDLLVDRKISPVNMNTDF